VPQLPDGKKLESWACIRTVWAEYISQHIAGHIAAR
jgi:hypothetical protein